MIARLLWASSVAALAESYRDEGVRPRAAFGRALDACRDPSLPVIPEPPEPSRRKAGPRITPNMRALAWLREQRVPVGSSDLAAAMEIDVRSARRHLLLLGERGDAVVVGDRRDGTRTRPERLWRAT